MGVLSDSNIFVYLSIFYPLFIALVIALPFEIILENEAPPDLPGYGDEGDWWDNFLDVFSTFFTSVTGLPDIMNLLLFTPLTVLVIYWIVRFIGWIVPFVGG